jgi:molecular chaperone HscB
LDYFSIFGLSHRLALDTSALEQAFYTQSRRLHPDRFAARPAAEQEQALAASSALNDAYRTLKDPIARTEHLLRLQGVELEEQSRAATDAAKAAGTAKKPVTAPELLEEAFELNMQLEEMRMARRMGEDDPATRADLQAARTRYASTMDGIATELHALWSMWDGTLEHDLAGEDAEIAMSRRGEAVTGMTALLNRRSYVRNLLRDVNDALA